jgi:MYXO-CTERM domain-containing protein
MQGFKRLVFAGIGTAALAAAGGEPATAAPYYGTYVHGMIHNSGCSSTGSMLDNNANCFFSGTSPSAWSSPLFQSLTTSATGAVGGAASGHAEASADLATGDLFASASSTSAAPNGTAPLGAVALAGIFETIQFHGAAPGTVGTVRMTGTATYAGDVWAGASILVQQGAFNPMLDTFYFMPETVVDCTDCSGTTAYERTATFSIVNDVDYTFIAIVRAFVANDGLPGTLSITDPISFELPDGLTFTSGSDQLLQAPPTHGAASEIPEPAALGLFGLGLLWLARTRRGSDSAGRAARGIRGTNTAACPHSPSRANDLRISA